MSEVHLTISDGQRDLLVRILTEAQSRSGSKCIARSSRTSFATDSKPKRPKSKLYSTSSRAHSRWDSVALDSCSRTSRSGICLTMLLGNAVRQMPDLPSE